MLHLLHVRREEWPPVFVAPISTVFFCSLASSSYTPILIILLLLSPHPLLFFYNPSLLCFPLHPSQLLPPALHFPRPCHLTLSQLSKGQGVVTQRMDHSQSTVRTVTDKKVI